MQKKRIYIFLICIAGGMMLLLARLVQIQLFETESFSKRNINLLEESVMQRVHAVSIHDGRGSFVDRTGKHLVDDVHGSVVLFPFLKYVDWPVEQLAHILDISPQHIMLQLTQKPVILKQNGKVLQLSAKQVEDINHLKVPGVVAVYAKTGGAVTADHLIGITGQNDTQVRARYGNKIQEGVISPHTPIGISGLQRAFDEFLVTSGESKLLYHVDRTGEPMFGKTVKYSSTANPFYPLVIRTTLDKELQQLAEKVVDDSGMKKGGLVLLDVQSGEILAMVSKPSLATYSQHAYTRGAKNQMLSAHIPGSVFKTVVAAAAIDKRKTSGAFNCDQDLYGEGPPEHEMGMLTFKESFAQSCNYTFAKIASELIKEDEDVLERYAKMLGLSQTVGWKGNVFHFTEFKQFPEEEARQIWKEQSDKHINKAIAQTAIGQKNVRVSPLAVANMMATIARGGQTIEVTAVKEIQYKNGAVMHAFPVHEVQSQLSQRVMEQLQQLLRSVVTSSKGTGKRYQSLPVTVAGKSGTAETGNDDYVNRWFAGYFPYEAPRYALVSVELYTNEVDNLAGKVFADYVEAIANKGM
ncbi:peptidoglycan D,D-transpeptidase FtsI family protein [Ectobacillus antri]|jgi:cell division protein FtsI/penicillin-binding protein 2|uniref:peptidoglycan D,D-transpeptidase FtsI family protein n=1 Tax=Ectobacillus antri TaxID=2486280 RepID=UPI000F594604|nr:penicillin-binding protein 2 [Ectobacillus antri]